MTKLFTVAAALVRKTIVNRRNARELKLELAQANKKIAELEVTIQMLKFQLEDVRQVNRRLAQREVDRRSEESCRKTNSHE